MEWIKIEYIWRFDIIMVQIISQMINGIGSTINMIGMLVQIIFVIETIINNFFWKILRNDGDKNVRYRLFICRG